MKQNKKFDLLLYIGKEFGTQNLHAYISDIIKEIKETGNAPIENIMMNFSDIVFTKDDISFLNEILNKLRREVFLKEIRNE